jgi:hypothetical protein
MRHACEGTERKKRKTGLEARRRTYHSAQRTTFATMRSFYGVLVTLAALIYVAVAAQGLYTQNSALDLTLTKDNFAELVLESNSMYEF